MDEMLGRYFGLVLPIAVFMLIIVYAFSCMILGPKKARRAMSSLVVGSARGGIRIAARILKIAIMFVINLTTMIIRNGWTARPSARRLGQIFGANGRSHIWRLAEL